MEKQADIHADRHINRFKERRETSRNGTTFSVKTVVTHFYMLFFIQRCLKKWWSTTDSWFNQIFLHHNIKLNPNLGPILQSLLDE